MLNLVVASMVAAVSALQSQGPAAHEDGPDPVRFTVRVENVSQAAALKLSMGGAAAAPTAPVLWVVHTASAPLFTTDELERGMGLEQLAEDGDPSRLAAALSGGQGIVASGFVNVPKGDVMPGAITPGKAYEFEVAANAGDRLTLAFMFGQSNDLFYSPAEAGIALFDAAGRPVRGDITRHFQLWDAGTELNQEPGAGADQAPRQKAPDTGASEKEGVALVWDGFRYPATAEVIRVTLTPIDQAGHVR